MHQHTGVRRPQHTGKANRSLSQQTNVFMNGKRDQNKGRCSCKDQYFLRHKHTKKLRSNNMSTCGTERNNKHYYFWGDFHMAKRHQKKFNNNKPWQNKKHNPLLPVGLKQSKLLGSGATHKRHYLWQSCPLTQGFFTSDHAIFPVRLIH